VRAEIRTASGGRLVVDPGSLEVFAFIDLNGGAWEAHDIAACKAVLERGQVFYDVGANAGVFTVEIAAAFDDAVQVRAFEPQPSLARSLALSAARNGFRNVHVHPVILGAEPGEVDLFIPASTIHASVVARDGRSQRLACAKTTIDAEVERGALPALDVIKMDVEGAERSVVQGALETIARHEPSIVFESDINQDRFGYSRADLCAELRFCADYRFFAVEREGGFTPLDRDGAGPSKLADSVLAITKRRFDAARLGVPGPPW
jgi:FkbM family methyltransferase